VIVEYQWTQTSRSVYRAIYDQHKDDFSVFESYTEMDDHCDRLKAQITAWGFKDAEHPLIRSELRDFDVWTYSILKKAFSDDE